MGRRKGRVKDKWREKKWVTINLPEALKGTPISHVPITDEEGAVGRVLEITLHDVLKGDLNQNQRRIYLQIDGVSDGQASTIFKGFEYSKELLRSLVRRGSSKINFITDVKTKDGYIFRVKTIALTYRQLNTSRKHALRLIARDIINERVPQMTLEQLVQEVCFGKIEADIKAAFKKVIKVRYAGLEKVKLIRTAEKETVLLEA